MWPCCFQIGVVAVEEPLAAVDSGLLVLHAVGHVDTVGDAVAIGDDEGGAVVGFGFEEGFEGVLVFGAHGDACHVDVAVSHGDQAEVLLAPGLASGRELGDGAPGRGLGHLAAGIRVDFGVEHEDFDVTPAGEHMVEAAEADVVGPAVAADDPHALAHQHVGELAAGLRRATEGWVDCNSASLALSSTMRSRWSWMPASSC